MRRLPRKMLVAAAAIPGIQKLLTMLVFADATFLARVQHRASNAQSLAASFDDLMPPDITAVSSFEDCAWLFSSNVLNHALSRQGFDEAAYLYRLVSSLGSPRVAEVGRYKGGTAFLLAAAGARVLSIDVKEASPGSDLALARALARVGLTDRVEIVQVSAPIGYVPNPHERYDLVFFDVVGTEDWIYAQLELWWATIPPGGSLIARDGIPYPQNDPRAEITAGIARAAARFREHVSAQLVPGVGTYMHLVKLPGERASALGPRRAALEAPRPAMGDLTAPG